VFKKIVWATDGSAAADVALPYAMMLAADGELLVVHCQELVHPGTGSPGVPVRPDEPTLLAKVQRQVQELADEGVATQLKVIQTGAVGAAREIAELAHREGADVIVTGSRGLSTRPGLVARSVTPRLLHIASCPVLAVPAGLGTETSTARYRTAEFR